VKYRFKLGVKTSILLATIVASLSITFFIYKVNDQSKIFRIPSSFLEGDESGADRPEVEDWPPEILADILMARKKAEKEAKQNAPSLSETNSDGDVTVERLPEETPGNDDKTSDENVTPEEDTLGRTSEEFDEALRIAKEASEREWDRLMAQLSEGLFASVSNLDILSTKLGDFGLGVRVSRSIYDNKDIFNSWTVIDTFKVDLSVPIFGTSSMLIGGGPIGSLSFSLGTSGGLEFMNIRQVLPNRYSHVPKLEERAEKLKQGIKSYTEARAQSESVDDDSAVVEINTDVPPEIPIPDEQEGLIPIEQPDQPWYIFDPLRKAQYSKFWNLVAFPARLPLSVDWLKYMDKGEIMSYNVSGTVQLGGGIGWNLDVSGLTSTANFGVGISTYLRGDFNIAVLKEDDRFVRVKLMRKRTTGKGFSIGAGTLNETIFEGVLIASFKIGKQNFKLIPFKLSVGNSYSNVFDVSYRYDLHNEIAKEAYQKAVLGFFALSEEASKGMGRIDNPPVVKTFERDSLVRSQAIKKDMQLWLIVKHGDETTVDTTNACVTLRVKDGEPVKAGEVDKTFANDIENDPDVEKWCKPTKEDGYETRHIFQSIAYNSESWRTWWGWFEKFKYHFKIQADYEDYIAGKQNSLSLVVDGSLEDSSTDGMELRQYINEVEYSIGVGIHYDKEKCKTADSLDEELKKDLCGIFPRLPIYAPIDPNKDKIGRYDRNNRYNRDCLDQNRRTKRWREKNCKMRPHAIEFGRSSFFYRLIFSQAQVEKFINTPRADIWPILEKTFGVSDGIWSTPGRRAAYQALTIPLTVINIPLFVANIHLRQGSNLNTARKIHDNWIKLKGLKKGAEKIKTMGELFSDNIYSYELVRCIRMALPGEKIEYFASGSNDHMGRIIDGGDTVVVVDPVYERLSRELFDKSAAKFDGDREAIIYSYDLKVIDRNLVEARFVFRDKAPNYVFFRLEKSNRLTRTKTLLELVVYNDGKFKVGNNLLEIDKRRDSGIGALIAEKLEKGNYYTLYMGISRDGETWGPLSQKRFNYDGFEDEEAVGGENPN